MKLTSLTLLACVLTLAPAMVVGQTYVLKSHVIASGAVNGSSTNFKAQGTVGQSAIGTGTSTNFKGSWGFWYTLSGGAGTTGFFAQLGVLLEGAHNGAGGMSANLGSSLPLSHPFSLEPWNYTGTESVASGFAAAHPDVVDWIFVQVRDTTPDPTAPSMSVAAERAGFVKTDGSVVDTNGVDPLRFPTLAAGTYYVVVDHRNHVRAMTQNPPASVNDTLKYDFTDSVAKAYTTGPPRQKALTGGFAGLFAADLNHDQQVTASDFNIWLTKTKASAVGYQDADFNLDGQVLASDFNLWLTNTKAAAAGQVPNP